MSPWWGYGLEEGKHYNFQLLYWRSCEFWTPHYIFIFCIQRTFSSNLVEKLLWHNSVSTSQGQFSINLIGTGLKVAEATKWTSQGNYVSVKVHRSEVRSWKENVWNVSLSLSLTLCGSLSWMCTVVDNLCRRLCFKLGLAVAVKCHLNWHVVFLCDSLRRNPHWHLRSSYSLREKLPFAHSLLPHLFLSVGRNKNLRPLRWFLWEVHSPGSQRPTPWSPLRAVQRPNP